MWQIFLLCKAIPIRQMIRYFYLNIYRSLFQHISILILIFVLQQDEETHDTHVVSSNAKSVNKDKNGKYHSHLNQFCSLKSFYISNFFVFSFRFKTSHLAPHLLDINRKRREKKEEESKSREKQSLKNIELHKRECKDQEFGDGLSFSMPFCHSFIVQDRSHHHEQLILLLLRLDVICQTLL